MNSPIKFKKERNRMRWMSSTGTLIYYDSIFKKYIINKGNYFRRADTLDKAKEIVIKDRIFW